MYGYISFSKILTIGCIMGYAPSFIYSLTSSLLRNNKHSLKKDSFIIVIF